MAIKPKCSEVSRIQTVVTEIVRLSQEQSELLKVPLRELRETHLEGHRRRQREISNLCDEINRIYRPSLSQKGGGRAENEPIAHGGKKMTSPWMSGFAQN